MIDPVSDDLTIPIKPRRSANRLMMISGALPNVALSKPPRVGPRYSASDSVASPISPASGMIARAETLNSKIGSTAIQSRTIATGTKTSSHLSFKGRLDRCGTRALRLPKSRSHTIAGHPNDRSQDSVDAAKVHLPGSGEFDRCRSTRPRSAHRCLGTRIGRY